MVDTQTTHPAVQVSIAPKLSVARSLRDLGITARGAAMLACVDTSDASELADAIDAASPEQELGDDTMAAIANLLGIQAVARGEDVLLVPARAEWKVRDGQDCFELAFGDLAADASDDDLLAELESCNGYDPTDETYTVAWRARVELVSATGRVVDVELSADITVHPSAPDCVDGDDHDWQSPYEVLGGLKENPGVSGNGGGVIIREVCARCGCYRKTDTWATNPSDGSTMTRVSYENADDDSLAWVASLTKDEA